MTSKIEEHLTCPIKDKRERRCGVEAGGRKAETVKEIGRREGDRAGIHKNGPG